jgi:hypothetical protein
VIPEADQQSVMNKIMSVSDHTFSAADVPAKLSVASYYYRFYLAHALVHSGLGNRYLEDPEGLGIELGLMSPARKSRRYWRNLSI